jgi:hypothetical protein
MDDLAKWRHPDLCVEVLIAGVNYLYDTLEEKHSGSNLAARVRALGDLKLALERRTRGDPFAVKGSDLDAQHIVRELNTLGTIGYGLWHLRPYYDSSGFRFELKELSRLGDPSNPAGDDLRLRGQGFLFHAAGVLARDGFGIEFIPRRDGERRPDIFAVRDGLKFPCEITSKAGITLRDRSVNEFWGRILEVVAAKKEQFSSADFADGVIIIDASPVFHLVSGSDVPIGGTLCHLPGRDQKGPPGGSVPLIRYDASDFSQGLQRFEKAIGETRIRNLVLWNRDLEIDGDAIRRRFEYRVIGTIGGNRFWAYFPTAVVFPGPDVQVVW